MSESRTHVPMSESKGHAPHGVDLVDDIVTILADAGVLQHMRLDIANDIAAVVAEHRQEEGMAAPEGTATPPGQPVVGGSDPTVSWPSEADVEAAAKAMHAAVCEKPADYVFGLECVDHRCHAQQARAALESAAPLVSRLREAAALLEEERDELRADLELANARRAELGDALMEMGKQRDEIRAEWSRDTSVSWESHKQWLRSLALAFGMDPEEALQLDFVACAELLRRERDRYKRDYEIAADHDYCGGQAEASQLRQRVQRLEADLAEARDLHADTLRDLQESTRTASLIAVRSNKIRAERDRLSALLRGMARRASGFRKRWDEESRGHDEARAEAASYATTSERFANRIAELERKSSALLADLHHAEDKRDQYERDVHLAQTVIGELRAELQSTQFAAGSGVVPDDARSAAQQLVNAIKPQVQHIWDRETADAFEELIVQQLPLFESWLSGPAQPPSEPDRIVCSEHRANPNAVIIGCHCNDPVPSVDPKVWDEIAAERAAQPPSEPAAEQPTKTAAELIREMPKTFRDRSFVRSEHLIEGTDLHYWADGSVYAYPCRCDSVPSVSAPAGDNWFADHVHDTYAPAPSPVGGAATPNDLQATPNLGVEGAAGDAQEEEAHE